MEMYEEYFIHQDGYSLLLHVKENIITYTERGDWGSKEDEIKLAQNELKRLIIMDYNIFTPFKIRRFLKRNKR